MKRLLSLLVILVAISSNASARVVSYRYMIPETDNLYSIEFPATFKVLSTVMDEFEPAVTIFGVDPNEEMERMKKNGDLILAWESSGLEFGVFVNKLPKWYECNRYLTDKELDEIAKEFGESFFYEGDGVTPMDIENPCKVYKTDNIRFLYLGYTDDEEGSTVAAEHFYVLDYDYVLDISSVYLTNDRDLRVKGMNMMSYICNSVKRSGE